MVVSLYGSWTKSTALFIRNTRKKKERRYFPSDCSTSSALRISETTGLALSCISILMRVGGPGLHLVKEHENLF